MLYVLAALVASAVRANEIDNHLVGDPVVDCQDTMVGFGPNSSAPSAPLFSDSSRSRFE
jgi:hypothetical protein